MSGRRVHGRRSYIGTYKALNQNPRRMITAGIFKLSMYLWWMQSIRKLLPKSSWVGRLLTWEHAGSKHR